MYGKGSTRQPVNTGNVMKSCRSLLKKEKVGRSEHSHKKVVALSEFICWMKNRSVAFLGHCYTYIYAVRLALGK